MEAFSRGVVGAVVVGKCGLNAAIVGEDAVAEDEFGERPTMVAITMIARQSILMMSLCCLKNDISEIVDVAGIEAR